MLPPLNVLSDSYEISLKPLHFTVTKWRFSNVSQLKLTLWQWDDNNSVILISSILRPPPTVLIRTCTCCSATETLTPWFRLCLAPRRLKKWRVLSIPQTSPSRRIAACLTAHVRRSVWGRGVGDGSKGSRTAVSVIFWLFSACFCRRRKWWISNGSLRSSFRPSEMSEFRGQRVAAQNHQVVFFGLPARLCGMWTGPRRCSRRGRGWRLPRQTWTEPRYVLMWSAAST